MAYGPLAQCAFMSGPPQFRKKGPMVEQEKKLWDSLPEFKPPDRCEPPTPGAFTLFAFDVEEAKNDPKYTSRALSLDDMRYVLFGSAQDIDGQVYDGHRTVKKQHACLYHAKGKWFLKAVNGTSTVESMQLHPYMRDDQGRPTKRYTSSGNKKIDMMEPMDPKKKLSREMCVFRLGESDRRFWIAGPLPLGDGESEEMAADGRERKKKDKRDDGRQDRERSRTRSRSRRRRK